MDHEFFWFSRISFLLISKGVSQYMRKKESLSRLNISNINANLSEIKLNPYLFNTINKYTYLTRDAVQNIFSNGQIIDDDEGGGKYLIKPATRELGVGYTLAINQAKPLKAVVMVSVSSTHCSMAFYFF